MCMSFMFSIEDEAWEGLDTEKPTHRIRAISSVVEVSARHFQHMRTLKYTHVTKIIWEMKEPENSKSRKRVGEL